MLLSTQEVLKLQIQKIIVGASKSGEDVQSSSYRARCTKTKGSPLYWRSDKAIDPRNVTQVCSPKNVGPCIRAALSSCSVPRSLVLDEMAGWLAGFISPRHTMGRARGRGKNHLKSVVRSSAQYVDIVLWNLVSFYYQSLGGRQICPEMWRLV